MNWHLRIDYFHPLEQEDLSLFAPPPDVVRAARSYNAALEQYIEGHEAEAMARLKQISQDFPLFPQASHLYGVLLACQDDFPRAQDYLGKVRLLEIPEAEREQLEEEYRAVVQEVQKRDRQRQRDQRREVLLDPVKHDIARQSILQKADTHVDKEEVHEPDLFPDPAEKKKTVMTFIVGVSLAIFLLLLFFFLWRPAIIKEQAARREKWEKLAWLEAALADRAEDSYDVGVLLADYQAWLEAGRPTPTTDRESAAASLADLPSDSFEADAEPGDNEPSGEPADTWSSTDVSGSQP